MAQSLSSLEQCCWLCRISGSLSLPIGGCLSAMLDCQQSVLKQCSITNWDRSGTGGQEDEAGESECICWHMLAAQMTVHRAAGHVLSWYRSFAGRQLRKHLVLTCLSCMMAGEITSGSRQRWKGDLPIDRAQSCDSGSRPSRLDMLLLNSDRSCRAVRFCRPHMLLMLLNERSSCVSFTCNPTHALLDMPVSPTCIRPMSFSSKAYQVAKVLNGLDAIVVQGQLCQVGQAL